MNISTEEAIKILTAKGPEEDRKMLVSFREELVSLNNLWEECVSDYNAGKITKKDLAANKRQLKKYIKNISEAIVEYENRVKAWEK